MPHHVLMGPTGVGHEQRQHHDVGHRAARASVGTFTPCWPRRVAGLQLAIGAGLSGRRRARDAAIYRLRETGGQGTVIWFPYLCVTPSGQPLVADPDAGSRFTG